MPETLPAKPELVKDTALPQVCIHFRLFDLCCLRRISDEFCYCWPASSCKWSSKSARGLHRISYALKISEFQVDVVILDGSMTTPPSLSGPEVMVNLPEKLVPEAVPEVTTNLPDVRLSPRRFRPRLGHAPARSRVSLPNRVSATVNCPLNLLRL